MIRDFLVSLGVVVVIILAALVAMDIAPASFPDIPFPSFTDIVGAIAAAG